MLFLGALSFYATVLKKDDSAENRSTPSEVTSTESTGANSSDSNSAKDDHTALSPSMSDIKVDYANSEWITHGGIISIGAIQCWTKLQAITLRIYHQHG